MLLIMDYRQKFAFKDITNFLFNTATLQCCSLYWSGISFIEKLYLRMIGVDISRRVSFRGWCHVNRCFGSTIEIGRESVFNYSPHSNYIGLNHRCNISTLNHGATIKIGNRVGMSSTTVAAFKSIEIGDDVRIGANCIIMDGDFHLDDPRSTEPKPIKIENNVWLGYGVVVLKGVTIGEGSIVGINSVVTKDIPHHCVAAGNPCKVIRSL